MFVGHQSTNPRSSWIVVYHHGDDTTNEYGERVFGNTLHGSSMCWVDRGSMRQRRTPDGTFEYEERWLTMDEWEAEFPAHEAVFEIGSGAFFKVIRSDGGGNITGRTLFKVERLLG